jgi:hypothetical protein
MIMGIFLALAGERKGGEKHEPPLCGLVCKQSDLGEKEHEQILTAAPSVRCAAGPSRPRARPSPGQSCFGVGVGGGEGGGERGMTPVRL